MQLHLSNFYFVLSDAPPPCQVKVQDKDHVNMVNDINKLKEGVLNSFIPSAFADNAATSNVKTMKDRSKFAFVETGQRSNKVFHMLNGALEAATAMDELHHKL